MLTTNPLLDDKLKEECGVFAVYSAKDSAALTVLGLHALQHRGQEGAGIVNCNLKGDFKVKHANGLVGDTLNKASVINELLGETSIGHVRYSTSGRKDAKCAQPFYAQMSFGGFALAHNGNLTNADELRDQLIKDGCIFQSVMDTEVVIHLVARSKKQTTEQRLTDALKQVRGAYSIVAMDTENTYGVRDPHGVRPLVIGMLNDAFVLASETCALDIIGAKYLRDVEPGEMVTINRSGIKSEYPFAKAPSKFCIFEYIYFARPDSLIEHGQVVYNIRKNIGSELAKESHVDADMVVPVPDSGVPSAMGYANQSGIDFELGIIRNHYVGRTFIEPTEQVRHLGVKLKHNANTHFLKGKRIILVDDSIVRGTTSKKIVQMVKDAGASEVHMRIASPPTNNSCFYGVDTPEKEKLLASKFSVDEMAKLIGADSLAFISLDGLYKAAGEAKGRNNDNPQYCDACFTGDYPI